MRELSTFQMTMDEVLNSAKYNLMEGKEVLIISDQASTIGTIKEHLIRYYRINPKIDSVPSGAHYYSWKLSLVNADYQKGKLYVSFMTTVLCTGVGTSPHVFSGVVVEQGDPMSDHRVGNYSDSWTGNGKVFKESQNIATIDPAKWEAYTELGTSNGGGN